MLRVDYKCSTRSVFIKSIPLFKKQCVEYQPNTLSDSLAPRDLEKPILSNEKRRINIHSPIVQNTLLTNNSTAVEQIKRPTRKTVIQSQNYPSSTNIRDDKDLEDKPKTINVLDVDSIGLKELHEYFLFNLCSRVSSEHVINILTWMSRSRNPSGITNNYNELMDKFREECGSRITPELVAIFPRIYNNLPIAYALDYVRKNGAFSHKFLALQVDKFSKRRYFDFVRFEDNDGVANVPKILSDPTALGSYSELMGECDAKRFVYEQLQLHGHLNANLLLKEMEELPPIVEFDEKVLVGQKHNFHRSGRRELQSEDQILIGKAEYQKQKERSIKFRDKVKNTMQSKPIGYMEEEDSVNNTRDIQSFSDEDFFVMNKYGLKRNIKSFYKRNYLYKFTKKYGWIRVKQRDNRKLYNAFEKVAKFKRASPKVLN